MGTGELYRAQQNEERRRQAVRDAERYKDTIWHDKDKNLAGIQEVIDIDNITISREDIKAEELRLAAFGSQYGRAYSKGGKTWQMSVNDQTQATRARQTQQIDLRTYGLKAAKLNPVNIERWANEDRLSDENQRIEKQILAEIEMFNVLNLERIERETQMQNQIITFNEQQNDGDFNETPITEINPMDSCSGCGVDIHALNREQQEKEKIMKIGGIAAVGVGILLLYTRNNKK